MPANGKVPDGDLVKVQGDIRLATKTADAWKHLVRDAADQLHRRISIAAPGGGYRSFATQAAMHDAGSASGTRAARIKWGLNPNSTVAIAAAGNSTHGFGTSVDIVGTPMDDAFLALAKHRGFTRTFGSRDPNHFGHA